MTRELDIGDWIVHKDGGLTHKLCSVKHHGCHRTDGIHFCYDNGVLERHVPILVCELMKINKSLSGGNE